MEKQNILTADVLDILFDGRNKEYGAYELRKTYNRRMYKALASVFLFAGLCYTGYVLAGKLDAMSKTILIGGPDVVLDKLPATETPPPKPIDPPKPKQIDMKMVKINTPRIVPDDVVPPDEVIPENDDATDAIIGNVNRDGKEYDGSNAPIDDGDGRDIIAAPEKKDESDNQFIPIEKEAEYPGGLNAWSRYLSKSLENNYPQDAVDNGIQGTVVVEFIVDEAGNVSNVHIVSGPEDLQTAALTVIKKSGKWEPALQNGKNVRSTKRQPIVFKLEQP